MNIANSAISLTLAKIIGIGCQFISISIITKNLSLDNVGTFLLFLTFTLLARFLSSFGFDQILIREISREKENKKSFGNTFIVSLIFNCLISSIIYLIYINFFDFNLQINNLLIFLSFIMQGIFGSCIGLIRGFGKNLKAQIPEGLLMHLFFLVLIIIHSNIEIISLKTLFLNYFLSSTVVFLVYFSLIKDMRLNFKGSLKKDFVKYFKSAGQIIIILASTYAIIKSPTLIAAIFLDIQEVALIDIALKVASIPIILISSIGATYAGVFSNLKGMGFKSNFNALSQAVILGFVPSLIWTICLVFFGKDIIKILFGDLYLEAYPSLIILSISYLLISIGSVSSVMLIHQDNESILLKLSTFSILVLSFSAAMLDLNLIKISLIFMISIIIRDIGSLLYAMNIHLRAS